MGAVGHYAFLSPCAPAGREAIPELCGDPEGMRERVHGDVAARAAAFFDRVLGR